MHAGLDYGQFLGLDYFSLTIALMIGAWYGIWLGLDWFERVYEEQSHGGLVHHLATRVFAGGGDKKLEAQLAMAKARLKRDAAAMENLAETAIEHSREPVRKAKTARKRAGKKFK